jgi:hypothetical protein
VLVTTVEMLTAGGIRRAAEMVELAGAAGLDVACAAVLLVKESGGGRNVWGHDGVQTGGIYQKGQEVTREAYLAYKARRGELGAQGVGPTQLTFPPLQDEADAAGGCWDWRANVLTGFRHLAGLIRTHGERGGFRRYNGSGPAAERYADDALAKLADWRRRPGDGGDGGGGGAPLTYGMRNNPEVAALQRFLARTFPGYAGDLPATGNYLDKTKAVVAEFQRRAGVTGPDADGSIVGPRTRAALANFGF